MQTQTIIIDSVGGQGEHAWRGGVSPSLKAVHYKFPPCVMEYEESECLVLEEDMSYQETTGALLASGYEKLGTQEAANGMYVTALWDGSQTAPTLTARNAGGGQRMPDKENFNAVMSLDTYHCSAEEDTAQVLKARNYKDPQTVMGGSTVNRVVRRLTPRECERLQGFPDNWTLIGEPDENGEYWYTDRNGKRKRCADSARYKALGNSIAVGYANQQSGFWCWLARRIAAQYERQITMGSLFAGIGGFELAFSACGAKPVWSSEIEPFCVEVLRRRFGDEEAEVKD